MSGAGKSSALKMLEDMGFTDVELRKDLSGNDRMIKAISQ